MEELQWGQNDSNFAPHSAQYFFPSGFSPWHCGHFIRETLWGKGMPFVRQKKRSIERSLNCSDRLL
jgi:hypothetical protein